MVDFRHKRIKIVIICLTHRVDVALDLMEDDLLLETGGLHTAACALALVPRVRRRAGAS